MANDNSLGIKLKKLRVEYNFTQDAVAKKLGVSQQMYSKYERTDAALDGDMIKRICELYGVSADYLLDIKPTVVAAPTERNLAAYTDEEYINTIANRVIDIMKNSGGK